MSTSQRVSRGFRRFGLFLAAILLIVSLALAIAHFLNLRLWNMRLDQLPMVVGPAVLLGLIGLGLARLAFYGVLRVLGWVAWRQCRIGGPP